MADKKMTKLREKIIRRLGGFLYLPMQVPELKAVATQPAVKLSTEEDVILNAVPEEPDKRKHCEDFIKRRLASNLAELMIDRGLVFGEKIVDYAVVPTMKIRITVWVLPPEDSK